MGIKTLQAGALGLAANAALALAAPAAAQGQCSRETLEDVAARYVQAQKGGSIFALPVGEWVDYRENYNIVSSGVGVISQAADFAWHVAVIDTASCRVFVQGVILAPKPYVVGTRLAWSFNGLGQIDSVVTQPGDAGFDAQATHDVASKEDWGPLPADRRDTRETLTATARAYLDALAGKGTAPFAPDCATLENGARREGCAPPQTVAQLADPEITIDETNGTIAVRGRLGRLRGPEGPADAHLLRVEGGQIRRVHTISAK